MLKWFAPLVVGLALMINGCGGSDPAAPAANGKKKIVFIAKNSGNPYFAPLEEGVKKAAAEEDAEYTSIAPAKAEATSQLSIIQDQIARGVDIIAICPNSVDALNPTLKDAMDKGITVVTLDSDLVGHEEFRNAGVLTVDPETVGKAQIELMGSMIGYSGKFAILSATTDAPNQKVWVEYMKKTLAENPKYKDMQLVEVAFGNDEAQKSRTEAESLLTKYPDLKGIIAPTTVGIHAAAQVVKNAGKAATVKVTGLGLPNEMRELVKDGTVQAFQLWTGGPSDEGYLTGKLAIAIAKKSFKMEPGAKFNAGPLGEKVVLPKNVVNTADVLTFTKENIDQYHF